MKLIPLLTLTGLLTCFVAPPAQCSEAAAVGRLCQHLKERKQLLVDDEQSEIIWSDGAMFEVAPKFPAALQEMIAASASKRNLKLALTRLSADLNTFKDASVSRSSKGDAYRTVKSRDGTVDLTVASAYIDYLRERYPGARICVKGELSPVLFVVGGTVRGAAMAIRSAADLTKGAGNPPPASKR